MGNYKQRSLRCRNMETASDTVNLLVALATAVPALVAIVKANQAKEMIVTLRQETSQTNTQSTEASGVGQVIFNTPPASERNDHVTDQI